LLIRKANTYKNTMILTDTLGVAFDKIAMDHWRQKQDTITSLLSMSRSTIQDLIRKFLIAISLEEITAIHIADAFIKNFICILSRVMLTDQSSNLINSLMRKIARRFGITQYKTIYQQSNNSIERLYHSLLFKTLH